MVSSGTGSAHPGCPRQSSESRKMVAVVVVVFNGFVAKFVYTLRLQYFDAVGWASGRAFGL